MNCCLTFFLRNADFTVVLHVMCDGPLSHTDGFWVLTGGLKLVTREQLQPSVVLCGHMRRWLSSMKRTHASIV